MKSEYLASFYLQVKTFEKENIQHVLNIYTAMRVDVFRIAVVRHCEEKEDF